MPVPLLRPRLIGLRIGRRVREQEENFKLIIGQESERVTIRVLIGGCAGLG
jgi:hypothetical protein